jgi:hypothetical protein
VRSGTSIASRRGSSPTVIYFVSVTLPKSPERMGKPLLAELEGLRSTRRCYCPVLFLLDYTTGTLFVVRVADHADTYWPHRPGEFRLSATENQGVGVLHFIAERSVFHAKNDY